MGPSYQHEEQYNNILPLSIIIVINQVKLCGHCYRSKEEVISNILLLLIMVECYRTALRVDMMPLILCCMNDFAIFQVVIVICQLYN